MLRFLVTSLALAVALLAGRSAPAVTIDFDKLAPGTVVTTLEGVTFTFNDPSFDLVVATGFATTSPDNYLGVDDGLDDLFLPGDVLGMSFDSPLAALSLAVVTSAGTPSGAFELYTPEGSVLNGATPDLLLGTDEVYLLSVASAVPFSTAELRSDGAGLFSFNVDDVVTELPEPTTTLLLVNGCVALVLLWLAFRKVAAVE